MLEEYPNELSNIYEEIMIKRRAPSEVFTESPLYEKMKLTKIFYSLVEYVENRD